MDTDREYTGPITLHHLLFVLTRSSLCIYLTFIPFKKKYCAKEFCSIRVKKFKRSEYVWTTNEIGKSILKTLHKLRSATDAVYVQ